MSVFAPFFIAGTLISLIATPLVIKLGRVWGVLDYPNEIKIHTLPLPRIGGIAIFLTFAIASVGAILFISELRHTFMQNWTYWGSLALGATLVFILGLADDIWGMPFWSKLATEFSAAALMMSFGGLRIESIGNPFNGSIELGWLWIPVTALWIVGVTNAFNLIDGLDGLAGGIGFISTLTVLVVSLVAGGPKLVVMVTALLAGTLLGFLRFNFHPARIFLGDCGSLFIGFMLAVMSLTGAGKKTTTMALLVPLLVVGVPVLDTLSTIVRRLGRKVVKEGERRPAALLALFVGDKEHIHHYLLKDGCGHTKSVLRLYALSGLLGVFAVIAALARDNRISIGLILVGVISFFLVKHSGGLSFYKIKDRQHDQKTQQSGNKYSD